MNALKLADQLQQYKPFYLTENLYIRESEIYFHDKTLYITDEEIEEYANVTKRNMRKIVYVIEEIEERFDRVYHIEEALFSLALDMSSDELTSKRVAVIDENISALTRNKIILNKFGISIEYYLKDNGSVSSRLEDLK